VSQILIFPENPLLNDLVVVLVILIAFTLFMQLVKNSDRLILTLIGILMGIIIAKHFPSLVEQFFTFVDGWRAPAPAPEPPPTSFQMDPGTLQL